MTQMDENRYIIRGSLFFSLRARVAAHSFTAGAGALRLSRRRSWSCCLRTRQRTLSGLIKPLLAQQAAPCRMVMLCFGRSG